MFQFINNLNNKLYKIQSENFNKWQVNDLKNLLLQYNIDIKVIKGSGKYGNVIKKDLLKQQKNQRSTLNRLC